MAAAPVPYDPTREEVNVNSPKAKKAPAWPSHLVTQVNEEDEKIRQLEMQERIKKQRKKGKDEDGQELLSDHINQLQTADQNRNGGCNPCRSCLRCFFKNEHTHTKDAAGGPQEAGNGDAIGDPPSEAPKQALPRGVQEVDQSGGSDESESEAIEGLLPKQQGSSSGKKCLVLDLDETLVHSSFQPIECSFQVPIVIDGIKHDVFVLKRPYVDRFLKSVAEHFELVVFTASLSEYANPVLDVLDQEGVIEHRLFRESCVLHEGQAYVKDLSRLGRKLKDCIIVDNSPLSYLYDPQNAIGCTSWFGDPNDTELLDMCPILNEVLKKTSDVRNLLNANTQTFQSLVEDLTPEQNYTGGKNDDEED